ncbi:MAG: TatD family hydrolase [Bdellovibrionaceae bacterium]|nr:TatD family hydrolase [Pseudobdellovibrionaceae bacterium]MBX3033365.1 TatD family hydrolase [Pseudobdellovibrionaceae bacterium]
MKVGVFRFDSRDEGRTLRGMWIDAHSHLADPRWGQEADQVLAEAVKSGIGFFLQGGIGPEDWEAQEKLRARHPGRIGLCFGLHPYFVAAHDEEVLEIALDALAVKLPRAMALGETGLDFRPHIMKDSRDKQITFFQQQLELATAVELPVVLHLVQAHEEALQIMDLWGLPKAGGLVHSFNGSWHKAQDFLSRSLFLSVGGPVARPDNGKLHQAVRQMPLEFLLIETDSPDQPPPAFQGGKNPPSALWHVARAIADLRGVTPGEILDITASNFRRLFQL